MNQKNETTQVSILGCGWLGLPLAKKCLAEGFHVKGSTSTAEKLSQLEDVGITAFRLQLHEDAIHGDIAGFLDGSQIVIVDIPPGLRGNPDSDFVQKMHHLVSAINQSTIRRVLFVSSTSVFKDAADFPHYSEADVPNGDSETARQLATVERLLLDNDQFTASVLRMGGLCGPGRDPRIFLAGPRAISNRYAPVNLIHQEDGIALILRIIARNAWGEIFHGVHPEHPQRKTYAPSREHETLDAGGPSHQGESIGKWVSSTMTRTALDFEFQRVP